MRIANRIKLYIHEKKGFTHGNNFHMEKGAKVDNGFPWLVKIGNNVTLGPNSTILCHDGSTKKIIGYTKIGRVTIGDNVFVGAGTIILPNTKIGNNVVIGAGSVVSGVIEDNSIICGVPAKKIKSYDEFKLKNEQLLKNSVKYDREYIKVPRNRKKMYDKLENEIGFIL